MIEPHNKKVEITEPRFSTKAFCRLEFKCNEYISAIAHIGWPELLKTLQDADFNPSLQVSSIAYLTWVRREAAAEELQGKAPLSLLNMTDLTVPKRDASLYRLLQEPDKRLFVPLALRLYDAPSSTGPRVSVSIMDPGALSPEKRSKREYDSPMHIRLTVESTAVEPEKLKSINHLYSKLTNLYGGQP
jgi:hypothetical protein